MTIWAIKSKRENSQATRIDYKGLVISIAFRDQYGNSKVLDDADIRVYDKSEDITYKLMGWEDKWQILSATADNLLDVFARISKSKELVGA